MPELKHNFLSGRMNKDLDERLVPNGEYRDALNVEVSTSEGSDVGAIQTTMGNINLSNIPGLLNAFCVGSIADEKNDKLYWLIASDDKDVVAEYDYNTGNTNPVLVDMWGVNNTTRVLNFNAGSYITGINIIDDMLFWTDNNTEPKHINITRCKEGCIHPHPTIAAGGIPDFGQHTNFLTTNPSSTTTPQALWLGNDTATSRPIIEKHITTIKESPKTAPTLEMKRTTKIGRVGGITLPVDFTDVDGNLFSEGHEMLIDLDDEYDYTTLDILTLTLVNNNADELEVRVQVIDDPPPPATPSTSFSFWVVIQSIDTRVLVVDDIWEVELEEKEALFQFKFPRFAYRYKYEDGEYSTFSPFTEVAFLPDGGDFDYLPKKGFNLSMVNDVRYLAIKNFVAEEDLLPDGVTEIDILYKESNSPNIYTVKTLTRDSVEWHSRSDFISSTGAVFIDDTHLNWSATMLLANPNTPAWQFKGGPGYTHTKGYVKITSEMIHAVLPSNQLLRSWDNVPRKALAQEVSGNRLIYGNYLQNYNVPYQSTRINLWSKELNIYNDKLPPEQIYPSNAYKYYPAKSVKTLRTYQIGVVYIDEYGRETPVFSDDKDAGSSIMVEKKYANQQNKLTAQIINNPPSWAEFFKFFIKETSNEYYNLAVDRWYDAKDDNVWLSFPSPERNKVDIDTFLVLKKQHDSDAFVTEDARYKILAIENEAPIYIKERVKSFGTITDNPAKELFGSTGGTGFPLVGSGYMWVDETPWVDQGWDKTLKDKINLYVRLTNANTKSQWYAVANISLNTQAGKHYKIQLVDSFKDDIAFTSTDNTFNGRNAVSVEIMQRIVENKAEFDGRFFVKIHKDLVLKDRLIGHNADQSYYVVDQAAPMTYINSESPYNHSGTYISPIINATYNVGNRNTAWHGWGYDKDKIHYDDTGWSVNPLFPDHVIGDGAEYWRKVNNSGDGNHGRWFIDEQQAYTTALGMWFWNYLHEVWGQPLAPGTAIDDPIASDPGNWQYSTGSTPGAGWDGDNQGQKNFKANSTSTIGTIPPNIPTGEVHQSQGVRRNSNHINVSFTGVGKTEDGKGYWQEASEWLAANNPVTGSSASLAIHLESWSWHVDNVLFRNTLQTDGTIWRWAEDPDQIVYRTYGYETVDVLYNYSHGLFTLKDYITTHYMPYTLGVGTWWNQVIGPAESIGGNTNSRCICCAPKVPPTIPGGIEWPYRAKDCFETENRRERATFSAHQFNNPSLKPGEGTANHYLPTNPPNWVSAVDETLNVNGFNYQIKEYNSNNDVVVVDLRPFVSGAAANDPNETSSNTNITHPLYRINDPANTVVGALDGDGQYVQGMENASDPPNNPNGYAPGIRHDGMPNGETAPGFGAGAGGVTIGSDDHFPGHVTWQILGLKDLSDIKYSSHNPAIFETEPKEDIGLDIYYEVGQTYPIELNSKTNEQYIPIGSIVTCPGCTPSIPIDTRVAACNDNTVTLVDDGNNLLNLSPTNTPADPVVIGTLLYFIRADGSATSARVDDVLNASGGIYGLEANVWKEEMRLPWFNCYSFGNGVESDRIRDDYNQVTIDNGPKASTTLDEPYMEERRSSGLIYSGLYNSTSGINNLNQFVMAEKITKDLNPTYGSIQKLHTRDTNLVTLCEDKILKVLANKDALYNADGNANLTATANVLGQTTPFIGEYGISKNPESFASESYRVYFSDKTRGAVLRLSQDGLTPISKIGMKDYFSDNLRAFGEIVGSYDDKKKSYNITLRDSRIDDVVDRKTGLVFKKYYLTKGETISFNETSKGWSSFKSFIPENGIGLNNNYYTFKEGDIWRHHEDSVDRNSFYDSTNRGTKTHDSSVTVLLNEESGSVKSFSTLNYEGSQARITPRTDDLEYYNNIAETGWFVEHINTNLQEGDGLEFKSKEDKWFSQIKGIATTLDNLDTREFSAQGIDEASVIDCPNCPYSWQCVSAQESTNSCDNSTIIIPSTPFSSQEDFIEYVSDPANNYTSTDPASLYSCVEGASSGGCTCGHNGALVRGYRLGFSVTNVYTLGITSYTTWDDFLTTLINNWGTWTVGSPLTLGMTFSQAKAALNIWSVSQQIKYFISISEVDPCICSTITVCNCIEVIGSGGHASQSACENAQNCCGSGGSPESYNCTPNGCVDPGDGSGLYSTWCDCIEQGGGPLGPSGSTPGPCCDGSQGLASGYNTSLYELSCLGQSNIVFGCTDPAATNYYVAATIDNCTCVYPTGCIPCSDPDADTSVPGCCYSTQQNYNPNATCDDGSCIPILYGCTDPTALNYYSAATVDDGSCVYPSGPGCTDPTATNYNPLATVDDGSCCYDYPLGSGSHQFDCCDKHSKPKYNHSATNLLTAVANCKADGGSCNIPGITWTWDPVSPHPSPNIGTNPTHGRLDVTIPPSATINAVGPTNASQAYGKSKYGTYTLNNNMSLQLVRNSTGQAVSNSYYYSGSNGYINIWSGAVYKIWDTAGWNDTSTTVTHDWNNIFGANITPGDYTLVVATYVAHAGTCTKNICDIPITIP